MLKHRQSSSCSWYDNRKNGILLRIEKAPEIGDGNLTCHVFILEDAVAHLATNDPI